MADGEQPLAPPAVAALREESLQSAGDRALMLRTISMDIREEREDLKKAAEQSLNAILELDLDGKVRWVSPSWQEVTGSAGSSLIGRPISDLIIDDTTVFAGCVEAMRKDDSKSHFIRFTIRASASADQEDIPSGDEKTPVEPRAGLDSMPDSVDSTSSTQQGPGVELEAQGIMVYDRTSGEESHTMWMVKPAVSREVTIDLPQVLVDSLGIGAEMLANYLTLLADVGVQDPANHPPPLPVLCRICERQITPWWFEKHTELCSQEYRAEMEVQMAQESLNEQRSAIVKVLDAMEAQSRIAQPIGLEPMSPSLAPKPEYKGMPIGHSSSPSTGPSSGRASPAHVGRSRESSASGLSHHRARSFAVRRPLARIVELVLDICDTAMEISTPAIKDMRGYVSGEFRTSSPQSEGRIHQVMQAQSPSAGLSDNEQGLALLCDDTHHLARAKVEAVFRHRRVLEYSERIRVEYDILVQECIEAALQKAARIAAGELSDSSESGEGNDLDPHDRETGMDSSYEILGDALEQSTSDEMFSMSSFRSTASPSAMAMAMRNSSDQALRRRQSSVGSSRASSPHGGAITPRSYAGPTEPFPLHKRGSIAFESDAGAESDSSMRSSVASESHRRAQSPSAELSLSRVASTRSRDRKRQSLVLPSLQNVVRHQSPARGPPAPSSPLRMAKPRIPSSADSLPSPITSPILTQSEFNSPVIRAQHHHHRRQSSAALSEAFGRPASPRLSAVISNPQPRAVQTSIKDFEIIKPISKGAFGSVYLSKKKSTGDYYAIKVLKKADMVAKNQVTNVKAERAIMMWQGESDFVAKLYWTFSSKDYLYLVMEYLNGGDCASLIKVLGALPEDWTKKYIGEVVLCVQHLHSRQIVHRDLKPDNLLIDAKGHLKLTDFGLSRMGLIGRQKRAINAKPGDAPPDLLKSGPFRRAPSVTSSRSASLDYQGAHHSPVQTPAMTPALCNDHNQPSYFSLYRESSREPSRRTSGHRSDSGDSDALSAMFRRFSVADGRTPIEEETASEEGADSPDPYALQPIISSSSVPRTETQSQQQQVPSQMPPPMMALFDPEDSNRRFVGTPDYLAPETINGAGQDEMSDWWSLGCILFETLYGRPPFNADTPEEVFQNILTRNIRWPPEDEDDPVSEEAKDLMNKLMCLDPKERLGSNKDEKFASGGDEIKAHPWFDDIHWDTLREDEASFIPASDNPEDTEYFDSRGATMQNFAAEFEDQATSPAQTPGADYPDRPHDALSRVRTQVNAVKRNLMPLHIPPHVRDARSRRLSEPVVADDFGNFQFKNLPVLEKANKDVIQKLRADAMQAQAKTANGAVSTPSSTVVSPSPAPSLESSPIVSGPLKRTLSANKGTQRPHSPSTFSQANSSPSRGSQPSSPLLVSFSAGHNQERRKTSSGSSSLSHQAHTSLQPGHVLEQAPRLPVTFKATSSAPSPIKSSKTNLGPLPAPHDRASSMHRHPSISSPRQRSHTLGSQDPEGDLVPEILPAHHHKRRSGVFDVSPSSSDNEETRQKALLRVQRRRQSSRRLSQISLADGPSFRTLDVLVCEDHPVSRLVMERLLEKLRCRTIAVTNGSEAMRYAMSEVKFDIIMMEYKLPQVNGADVARMIRDTKNANSHTPIVAVTGYLKELHAPHSFDALVEKPPTKEKLEEVMGRLCQWKTPPAGWKPSAPQALPSSLKRQETAPTEHSPTTTTSSGFTGFNSIFSGTRENSIGSSSLGELDDGVPNIPLIISRQPTSEFELSEMERNFGGLGISHSVSADNRNKRHASTSASLEHQNSAPAALETTAPSTPRRVPSNEAVAAKRKSLEKLRHESAAESGDDEDEELGNVQVRQRSPKRSGKRTSKLGTEMMRTNSQGSVISSEDLLSAQSPRTATIAEEIPLDVGSGHLTPPIVFTPRPGDHVEIINMADAEEKEEQAP
ncbi:Putative serine/threonine-protein kinase, active [Septoria linicola]|uniref:non-specific serine/threonine protein kinase n=1 Tax=Septoria linicola TaxID=215465 RepID=A0A9Q9AKL4_9PEZI|nr:putative serine/threonine-protein kinase, active [Septoria linicola]USW47863.1 Putative serine/threonine-protein kinase, active [Septoria linicola]